MMMQDEEKRDVAVDQAGGDGADETAVTEAGQVGEVERMGVMALIEKVQEGLIDASDVPADRRRECVAFLTEQGLVTAQIARLMGVTDRTVRRDRATLRAEGAIEPSDALAGQTLGELYSTVQQSIQRLRRVANDPLSPMHLKVWAEAEIMRRSRDVAEYALKIGFIEDAKARRDRLARERSAKLTVADIVAESARFFATDKAEGK